MLLAFAVLAALPGVAALVAGGMKLVRRVIGRTVQRRASKDALARPHGMRVSSPVARRIPLLSEVSIQGPIATSEYAQRRLKHYEHEGIGTVGSANVARPRSSARTQPSANSTHPDGTQSEGAPRVHGVENRGDLRPSVRFENRVVTRNQRKETPSSPQW